MPVIDFKTISKLPPFKHQETAILQGADRQGFAYLMEMGTGKSLCFIANAAHLYAKGEINGVVLLAPKSICRNWSQKEIPTHLPDHIGRKVVLWGADSKQLQADLAAVGQVDPLCLHILIMNIEAVGSDRGYDALSKFLKGHHALMGVDESSVIKNPKAERSKIIVKLGKLARYRRIMTGTLISQSPLDAFMQFEFLQGACLGNQTYFGFRNQYAVLRRRYVNGRNFDEVVGFQRLEELKAAIGRHAFIIKKEECLTLPPKIYQIRYIEMTDEQARYYKQLRDDALAYLSNGDVVATPQVLTKLMRLRQALCNLAPKVLESPVEEWLDGQRYGDTQLISAKDPRAQEVLALLEEAGEQKVLIWANFVPSIKNLREVITKEYGPEAVGCIYGDVPQIERQALVTRFQDKGDKLRFLVMQPRTGGYGLTLTAATLVIYHDHDWSLEVRLQSEDRAHRIGQDMPVTYVDLVAQGTVDEKIREALVEKKDLADRVTGHGLRDLLS